MSKRNCSILKRFTEKRAPLHTGFGLAPSIRVLVSVLTLGSFTHLSAESIPMLRNLTTGKTIFHDDFESYTVPASPTALHRPASDKALVGTWAGGMVFNPFGTLDIGIVNTSRSACKKIVPEQGRQFFMISSTEGEPVGQTWTGRGLVENSRIGESIEANIAFKLISGSNRALFYLYGGPNQDQLLAAFSLNALNLNHRDFSLSSHNGIDFQQTRLDFKPNVWNTLRVRHTNGTSTWDVSLNGGTPITVPGFPNSSGYNVNAIFFNQTTDSARGTTVYFNAVAREPAAGGAGR